jgi:hypothetical protein
MFETSGMIRFEFFKLTTLKVGPLPPKESTNILPLSFCYNSDRNYAANPIPDMGVMLEWTLSLASNTSDIIEELLDGVSIQISVCESTRGTDGGKTAN